VPGPSLSGLWNRKAAASRFDRYLAALASSGIIWDDTSLDPWIADPQHFIPGNTMALPGVKDARQRSDLLAFLKEATQPGRPLERGNQMGGMTGGGPVPNFRRPT
jgi:cytochrome c